MPMKRRAKVDTSATKATELRESPSDARADALQGLHLDVYRFVQNNPNCTRDDVARGLRMKSSTATARIKELIDEGYLMEPPGMRKTNPSGVSAKCLHTTVRPQGGAKLDKVRVEVMLTIDCDGNYGASAKIVGGSPQRTRTHVIKRQHITITAPHPDTYKSLLTDAAVERLTRAEVQAHVGEVIDADSYTVVND